MTESAPLSLQFKHQLERLLDEATPAEGFLVGVSGGLDSVALLRLLKEFLTSSPPSIPLTVIHFNHGLRGEESDRDQAFVESLCRDLKVECISESLAVQDYARETRIGIEQAARELRYQRFLYWAKRQSRRFVLTAHHADDQRETILFRILRGTGLKGLQGIPEERLLEEESFQSKEVRVLRPLLSFDKIELKTYLQDLQQPHREDSSNQDLSIKRNAIRNKILPELTSSVHPGAQQALSRLALQAQQLYEDLESITNDYWERISIRNTSSQNLLIFKLEPFQALTPTIKLIFLKRIFSYLQPEKINSFTESQFLEYLKKLNSVSDISVMNLNSTVSVTMNLKTSSDDKELIFQKENEVGLITTPCDPVSLAIPGQARWGRWKFEATVVETFQHESDDPLSEIIDLDLLEGPIEISPRREGDRFWPLGAGGNKKLKEFFRECRLPQHLRDQVPILRNKNKILWVVGQRLADPFKVTDKTTNYLKINAVDLETLKPVIEN